MKYYVCKTKFSFGHLPSGSVLGVLGVKSQMYFSMGFSWPVMLKSLHYIIHWIGCLDNQSVWLNGCKWGLSILPEYRTLWGEVGPIYTTWVQDTVGVKVNSCEHLGFPGWCRVRYWKLSVGEVPVLVVLCLRVHVWVPHHLNCFVRYSTCARFPLWSQGICQVCCWRGARSCSHNLYTSCVCTFMLTK